MTAEKKRTKNQSKIGKFFKGVRTEFSKIIWPGRETMAKQLAAVLCVTVAAAVLIAVTDFGMQNLIDFLVRVNAG